MKKAIVVGTILVAVLVFLTLRYSRIYCLLLKCSAPTPVVKTARLPQAAPSIFHDPTPLEGPDPLPVLSSTWSTLKSKILGKYECESELRKQHLEKVKELRQWVNSSRRCIKSRVESYPEEQYDPSDFREYPCVPQSKGSVKMPYSPYLCDDFIFFRLLYDDMNLVSDDESLWKEPSKFLLLVSSNPTPSLTVDPWPHVFLDLADPEYYIPRLRHHELAWLTVRICDYMNILGSRLHCTVMSKGTRTEFKKRRLFYVRCSELPAEIDFDMALKGNPGFRHHQHPGK